MRVLIVGGRGVFGSRLARLLAGRPGLTLVIAGRDAAKNDAFAATLPAGSAVAARLDRNTVRQADVAALSPDVLVDASGPFQAYGAAPHRLVELALAARAHYLDLADDPAFMAGVAAFDAAARARGRVVLSGLSTVPALSGAVARRLAAGLQRVDRVFVGVAPAATAPLGRSVVEGALRQAGRPADGRLGACLVDSLFWTIAPPGVPPLRRRRFLLVQGLPSGLPQPSLAWVGAGVAPQVLLGLLNGLAWAASRRLLPHLSPLAGACHRVINAARWGEARGGMIVVVEGRGADGQAAQRSWHLIAEGEDGPFIPAMAAAAVVSKLASDSTLRPGARAAAHDLELADFEPLFAARAIVHGVRA